MAISLNWKIIVLVAIILTAAKGCFGIDEFESAASEFIFSMFPNHPDYFYNTGERNLHISTQENSPVTVTVRISGGSILYTTVTVTANTGTKVNLPYTTAVRDYSSSERNKGIEVTAQDGKSIRVAVENYAQFSSDSYLILPILDYPVMNYTYYVVSTYGPYASGNAIITAARDNTMVTITPTHTITIPSDLAPGGINMPLYAGNSVTFTLNRLQTFSFQSISNIDLTGTKIFTNKPISLISGHECGNVPNGVCCCDVLMEQIPPTLNWGKTFIFALLREQQAGTYFKVIGHKTGTQYNLRCSNGLNTQYSLSGSPGIRDHTITSDNLICSITSNEPISVTKFCQSQQQGNALSDPFMMTVPPIEQFSTDVTFPGYGDRFPTNYINIAVLGTHIPTGVYLENTLINSGWTAARYPNGTIIGYVTQVSTSGIQYNVRITEERKMMVYVYGYDSYDSYGYVAGMDLLPTAEVPDCGEPDLPNGTPLMVVFTTTFFTSIANYTCQIGYTLIGNGTRVCLENSSWSGTVPQCQIVDCGHLTVPQGSLGGLTVSFANTVYSSTAVYSCAQQGYNLVGSSNRVCGANGVWSGSAPYCLIVDCGTPSVSYSGDVSSMVSYTNTVFNYIALYSCQTGYNLIGDTSRTCLSSGQWSGAPPSCYIVDCGTLVVPQGSAGGLILSVGATTYNSTAMYSCVAVGYELIGVAVRVCNTNGNWSNTQPYCQHIDCGVPDLAIGNSSVLSALYSTTTYSSLAMYSCVTGYNLIGVSTRICQADKSWSDSSPYCQIVDCGLLSVPSNSLGGLSVAFSSTVFNTTATYSCPNLGYVLIGDAERVCLSNGYWSNSIPHCEIVLLNLTGYVVDARTVRLSWLLPPTPANVEDIVNNYVIEVTTIETGKVTTYFSVHLQALVINLHPFYNYSCRVAVYTTTINPFTQPIFIKTPEAAPTGVPLNPTLTVLNSRMLNVSWFPPSLELQNGIITSYLIRVNELDTNTVTEFSSNNTWLHLSALHPHYNYHITFAAVTVATGPFGSLTTIKMPPDIPTSSPTGVSAPVVTSTAVFITWQPPPTEHQNGDITHYIVNVTELKTGNNFLIISQNVSTTISSLHPFYNYSISIAAHTIGIGPSTMNIIVETAMDVPGGPPINLGGQATSPRSAILTWNSPPVDQHNGVLTGFVINVTILESSNSFILTSTTPPLILNTLSPFRTYIFIIAAQTSIGSGPFSQLFTINTPPDAPTASPSTVSTASLTSRSFVMHWAPPDPDHQNGIILYYLINVTEIETEVTTVHTSFSTTYSLTLLHPAYTYECVIAAYTVGLGPYSSPITVKTEEEPPAASPRNLQGNNSATSIAFSWIPPAPEDQNGVITLYLLNITDINSGMTLHYTTTATFITVQSLLPFTKYSCIIAASTMAGVGPFSMIFTIRTLPAPPSSAPMILTSYAVDSSTAILQWAAPPPEDHNGVIQDYVINITALNTGAYREMTFIGTTVVIVSLIPSFTYHFSVSARTVGIGPYSDPVTITMPQDAPTGFPRNVMGSSPSPYSVTLMWTAPPSEQQSGVIVQYVVNITHAGTLETTQHTTTTTNITIYSLEPFTTYICIIAAQTMIGTGPFSHFFFIQTQEAVPSSSPDHLSGVPVSPTSIHLTWDPPALEHHNGVIDGYLVNVTEVITNTFAQHFSNQTQITIEDLHPYYFYHCQVTAVTVGEGPYTDVVVVVTDEAAPSASPQSVSGNAASSMTITMSWSPPEPSDINGILREYIVMIEDVLRGDVTNFTSFVASFNATGLRPHTQYYCSVAAFTIAQGPFSAPISITTHQDAPTSPPESFNSTVISTNALLLQWNPPSTDSVNGVVQSYTITLLETDTGHMFQQITTNTYLNLASLHPYYTYMCSVRAVTISSGPAAVLTVQMPEDAPSSSPDNVTAIATSSTVVLASWNPLPVDNHNGIVRHYTIHVVENQTGIIQESNSTIESISIENLHPAYTYHISVAAVTIMRGPYSIVITVVTNEDVPSSSPNSLTAQVVDATTVQLSWSPPPLSDHNGVITAYTVSVVNTNTNEEQKIVVSSTSITLNSLDPFTNYNFGVTANTSVGAGPQSSFVSFLTHEDAPDVAPEDLNVFEATPTSFTLEWIEPPEEAHNGIIRLYIVHILEVSTHQVTVYNTSEPSLTVAPVKPYTKYECSVSAVTNNQGPFSEPLLILTPEAAPSAPPTLINVTAVTPRSLFITWSPPPSDAVNGVLTGYTVNVFVTETQQQMQHTVFTTELTLEQLHPYYTYRVTVSATTVAAGPFSMEYVIRTPPDAPSGPPQNISVDVLNSTSVQLFWTAPLDEHHNGVIESYTITVMEFETNSTKIVIQNFLHTSVVISSLHPYYNYQFSVAAHTVALGPSASTSTTTDQHAPTAPPRNVSATIASPTTVILHWTPPVADQQNGVILHYTILLEEHETESEQQYTSTGLSHTINDLHPHYTYTCTITAVTIGPGPGEAFTFQMPQDIPDGAPRGLQAVSLNSTTILLLWQPPEPHQHNGIILSYSIVLYEVESDTTLLLEVDNTTVTEVNSLHPSYTYEVRVAAITTGNGPYTTNIMIQLPESAPSGPPQEFSGISTTPYSIDFTWSPPIPSALNGIITGYVINITHADDLVTQQYTSGPSNNATIPILSPFITYICTIAARTSVGTGPFSTGLTVQTLESAPTGPPLHVGGVTVSATAIHITWDPPEPVKQNGIIRFYWINVIEEESGVITQYSINQTQITIENLHPYYTYNCTVAAVTVSEGLYSISVAVQTDQQAPSGAPQMISATFLNTTTVTIQWIPPVADQHNGVILHYIILLEEHETESEQQYTSTGLSHTINDLHPHYTYTCIITAVTIGPGPGEAFTFQMPEDAPSSSPQNISAISTNATSLVIQWHSPSFPQQNGIIRQYHVFITDTEADSTDVIITSGNSTQVTVNSLHPFYRYKIQMAAITILIGPLSDAIFITMPESEPSSRPRNFLSELTSNHSSHLIWSPPAEEDHNGVLIGYTLTCRSDKSHVISLQLPSTSTTLTTLRNHSHYTCTVCAYTSVGCGPVAVTYISTYTNSPVGPPNVSVANISATWIRIKWDPPTDPESHTLSYGLTYQLISSPFVSAPRSHATIANINKTQTTLILTPLLQASEYRIVMYTVTGEGTSPASQELITTTSDYERNAPQNFTCRAMNSTSIGCSWETHDVAELSLFGHQLMFRLIEGFDYLPGYGEDYEQYHLSPEATQHTIDGLFPYGGYFIELRAVFTESDTGSGIPAIIVPEDVIEYSTTSVEFTAAEVPEAAVKDVVVQVMSPRSILVSWLPPERLYWHGKVEHYNISAARLGPVNGREVARSPSVVSVTVDPVNNDIDPSLATEPLQRESQVVEDLEEYFEYSVSVMMVNSAGQGEGSQPVLQSMPPTKPSGPPINIVATNVTSSSITIVWSPPDLLNANGPIVGYILNFTRIGDTRQQMLPINSRSYTITGLSAYQQVIFTVSARTPQGQGPFSDIKLFRTAESLPSAPQSLSVTLNSRTTALIKWQPPDRTNGVLLGYEITYEGYTNTPNTNMTRRISGKETVDADVLMVTIHNLTPGLLYIFKVSAFNGAGHGANTTSSPASAPILVNSVSPVTVAVPVTILVIVAILFILMIAVCAVVYKKRAKNNFYLRNINRQLELQDDMEINTCKLEKIPEVFKETTVIENDYGILNQPDIDDSEECAKVLAKNTSLPPVPSSSSTDSRQMRPALVIANEYEVFPTVTGASANAEKTVGNENDMYIYEDMEVVSAAMASKPSQLVEHDEKEVEPGTEGSSDAVEEKEEDDRNTEKTAELPNDASDGGAFTDQGQKKDEETEEEEEDIQISLL